MVACLLARLPCNLSNICLLRWKKSYNGNRVALQFYARVHGIYDSLHKGNDGRGRADSSRLIRREFRGTTRYFPARRDKWRSIAPIYRGFFLEHPLNDQTSQVNRADRRNFSRRAPLHLYGNPALSTIIHRGRSGRRAAARKCAESTWNLPVQVVVQRCTPRRLVTPMQRVDVALKSGRFCRTRCVRYFP